MGASHLQHDAASMVESTADAAFASDEEGCIVSWNSAAEHLLGFRAAEAVGRPCHEILSGVDIFGNRYCRPDCSPREMFRCGQPVRGFQIDVRRASGEFIRMHLSVVALRGSRPSQFALVHVVRPASDPPASDPPSRSGPGDAPTGRRALSQREIDVLRLLAGGSDPRQIAEEMCVSLHTVRTHVKSILHKLEVHSTTHAVSEALGRRLI